MRRAGVDVELVECPRLRKFKRCKYVILIPQSRAFAISTPRVFFKFQNALPPGMLQQMQRQMRSGGGIQEMMKTLMQSQGGDQMDLEEMQRMMSQVGGLGGLGGGMPNMSDMFKLMGMGRGGGR